MALVVIRHPKICARLPRSVKPTVFNRRQGFLQEHKGFRAITDCKTQFVTGLRDKRAVKTIKDLVHPVEEIGCRFGRSQQQIKGHKDAYRNWDGLAHGRTCILNLHVPKRLWVDVTISQLFCQFEFQGMWRLVQLPNVGPINNFGSNMELVRGTKIIPCALNEVRSVKQEKKSCVHWPKRKAPLGSHLADLPK